MKRILVSEIKHGTLVNGVARNCKHCNALFIGRSNSIFCSDSCKVMNHNQKKKGPTINKRKVSINKEAEVHKLSCQLQEISARLSKLVQK